MGASATLAATLQHAVINLSAHISSSIPEAASTWGVSPGTSVATAPIAKKPTNLRHVTSQTTMNIPAVAPKGSSQPSPKTLLERIDLLCHFHLVWLGDSCTRFWGRGCRGEWNWTYLSDVLVQLRTWTWTHCT